MTLYLVVLICRLREVLPDVLAEVAYANDCHRIRSDQKENSCGTKARYGDTPQTFVAIIMAGADFCEFRQAQAERFDS